jgi:general secretion pathway protein K
MKLRHGRHTQGMALIVAVIAVLVLSLLAAGFALSMKVETRLAINANSETQLYWLGRSGVELARWVLAEQSRVANEPYDALNQIWAGGPGGGGETNGPLAGFSLQNYPIGDGTVSLKIIDRERYANINSATPQEIQQTLNLMGVDANDISVVSDSIQDWIQPGDSPRVAGAKDDYYMGLDPPYHCKEAPIDDLSELLLIRGITPAMYDPEHFNATNQTGTVFHHRLGLNSAPGEAPNYPFGLKDVFTAISNGKINVNTADANVLQLIPGVDAPTADAIIKLRAGPDGVDGTDDDTPIQNLGQLATAGINPQIIGQMGNLCGTRSSTFEVHVTARLGPISREYVALLWRASGGDIRVVSFYWVTQKQG